jgi:hypothetical protein
MNGTGPHLTAAALCEKVLQETDGIVSLIRIFDRLTLNAVGAGPAPGDLLKPAANMTLFISFKSGSARGKATVAIRVERPDGLMRDVMTGPVLFEGEERGVNVVLALVLQFELEGLYWFHVLLDEQLVTRIPLRIFVMYQQIQAGGPPPSV